MTERLNPTVLAWSLASLAGLAYIVCAIFFALAPQTALLFFQNMFHGLDLGPIASLQLPLLNAFLGLIETIALAALLGWLLATFYNYFAREMK